MNRDKCARVFKRRRRKTARRNSHRNNNNEFCNSAKNQNHPFKTKRNVLLHWLSKTKASILSKTILIVNFPLKKMKLENLFFVLRKFKDTSARENLLCQVMHKN